MSISLVLPAAAAEPRHDTVVALDTMVVSVTRTPQELGLLPASVSLVPLPALDAAQITDLRGALETVPGLAVVQTGAHGGQTSVFMRGANTHQVLFFIDGVRMNDRSAAYFNFLGGAGLAGFDRLEVLRGPQSTLYGSSALGGVILLETARGHGPTTGVVSATAGSLATFGGTLAVQGGGERFGVSASLSHLRTDNALPRNAFEQWSGSARLEGEVASGLRLGATVRAQDGNYEDPGSRFFAAEADVDARNLLFTAYADWAAREDFQSRLTYGRHHRTYRYADSFGVSDSENTRDIADWQNAWSPSPAFEIVAGLNAEWSTYDIGPYRSEDDVLAQYASVTARPAADVILTAGLRHDDFAAAGSAVTGRAGAAWLINDRGTTLRASYGTGFSAPGSEDVFGVPQWGQLPSPDLHPEESRGWDVGLDQAFADHRAAVSATWFENRFRDLFDYEIIDFDTFEGRVVNRARATTRGLELAGRVQPYRAVTLRGAYTYVEAINRDDDSRLNRRPRHVADFDVNVQVAARWLVGTGLHVAADRIDGGVAIEDYTTVRLYASWMPRPEFVIKARIENALDETYEEVRGYPSLPRAAYGSVEWHF